MIQRSSKFLRGFGWSAPKNVPHADRPDRVIPVLFSAWGRVLAIPACLLISCLHVHGQGPNIYLNVDSNLVLIDVQVLDSVSGQVLTELLRESDFVLVKDPVRDISVFEAEHVPLDLVLVLDTTGERLPFVLIPDPVAGDGVQRAIYVQDPIGEGIMRMLGELLPEDRVAVVSFSERPALQQALTTDREVIRNAVKRVMRERGRNRDRRASIYDAIEYASAVFREEPQIERHRVMFLITHNRDGSADPDRWMDTANSLRSINATLSALVVPQTGTRQLWGGIIGRAVRPPKDPDVLPELNSVEPIVEATAGKIFRNPSDGFWEGAIDRLSTRYRLGFYLNNSEQKIGAHSVAVDLTPQARIRWPNAIVRVLEPFSTPENLNPAPR